MAGRYVAYVSTYTMGDKHGIKIYDVDMERGSFTEKSQVEITNSSYVTIAKNRKFLYSITDFGIESYRILPDGGLEFVNYQSINGMRGCYVSTDYEDRFIFVAGYHDGKLTVLRLNEDGSIGEITEEIYHKGLGSVAERNFRPHIECARMTHDNKYLLVSDVGMDHVIVYELNHSKGTLKQADVIRCDLESSPRHIKMSRDGHYIYIVNELQCSVSVYAYEDRAGVPYFNRIQVISTTEDEDADHRKISSACALSFSSDYQYLLATTAGENTVAVFKADAESGKLARLFCLPVSGDYPKDASFFPDSKHLVSLNHESDTMTFFAVNLEAGHMTMCAPEVSVRQPNCVTFVEVE